MTKYVVDLPDNVSFIVGKGYVLFNEKEFLRIPVKQLEKYSKKEYVEVEKNEEIVYDVRKEERMSDKYMVSQEFMNELVEWKINLVSYDEHSYFIDGDVIEGLPVVVNAWWGDEVPDEENNNRLIAIIRWVNGEDVFEVEKPKKWVVRSKEHDEGGNYQYIKAGNFDMVFNKYNIDQATRFDTKEEAESWANSHQEVVEVEE